MDEVLQTQYLYIETKGLCVDLIEAAECFLENDPNLDFPKLKMNQGGGKFQKDLWAGWPRGNK